MVERKTKAKEEKPRKKVKAPKKGLLHALSRTYDRINCFLGGDLDFVFTSLNKADYVFKRGEIIKSGSTLSAFFTEARFALGYCILEPEILLFSIFNALSQLIAFVIFVYGFLAVAPEIYDLKSIIGLIVLWPLWFLACLWLSSNLSAVFTGAMGISVMKKMKGERSTVIGCLGDSLARRKEIQRCAWNLTALTVIMSLNLIPSKNAPHSQTERDRREFYGWRYGKFAILPHLLLGSSLIDAGKASVDMVKRNFRNVCLFRTGYGRVRLFIWFIMWAFMTWLFTYGPYKNPDDINLLGMIIAQSVFSLVPTFLIVKIFLYPVLVISSCRRTIEDIVPQSKTIQPGGSQKEDGLNEQG